MSEFNVDDILAEFRDGSRKKPAPVDDTPKKNTPKSIGTTDILNSIGTPSKKTEEAKKPATADDDYDEYKPTEPLFSMEQLRKIEAQRKENMKAQSSAAPTPEKAVKPATEKAVKPADKDTAKPVQKTEKATPVKAEDKPSKVQKPETEEPVRKTEAPATEKAEKQIKKAEAPAPEKQIKPAVRKTAEEEKRPATIFGDIEDAEKKLKKEKANVRINTNPFSSISEKVSQYRFLFEELVKRDFKKKYKRTVLGMLWSVISPFLTFLIQLFVFGSLFRRGDSNFVIYLLTGNLMFHFFSDTTTTGMFAMYSNASVLSKINVPKSIFLLSSNVAGTFNFFLTLLVYFIFMVFTGVSFGPHLFLMIYPILCMIIFNLGISYILSSLFVFFRDTQYLYSIATRLLIYMSAIFYYADSLPENIQFVFAINPIYRYIAYMRQLVIDSTIPNLTSHLVCFGFAAAALIIGYLFHKKTEKKFVYYY